MPQQRQRQQQNDQVDKYARHRAPDEHAAVGQAVARHGRVPVLLDGTAVEYGAEDAADPPGDVHAVRDPQGNTEPFRRGHGREDAVQEEQGRGPAEQERRVVEEINGKDALGYQHQVLGVARRREHAYVPAEAFRHAEEGEGELGENEGLV